MRLLRPLKGLCKFVIRCHPRFDYNANAADINVFDNGINYQGNDLSLDLLTNALVSQVLENQQIVLDQPYAFLFGMDIDHNVNPVQQAKTWLSATQTEWQQWVAGLTLPEKWQQQVIRAAIGLKLHWYEQTGAVMAALSLGIPAENANDRCWDYRLCWLRDAFYTVNALHQLGDKEIIKSYRDFLRPLLDKVSRGHIQCTYALDGSEELQEMAVPALNGYRGLGPVLKGNKASEQIQLDCFGHVLNIFALVALDEEQCDELDLQLMVKTAEQAHMNYCNRDSGFWELRGVEWTHTYSAIISWRAMDSMAKVFAMLGDNKAAALWNSRKDECREVILEHSWSEQEQAFVGYFEGDELDLTILHMADIGMLDIDDARLEQTVDAINRKLRRAGYLLPHEGSDDFGEREFGFNLCTFWFINSLRHIGREQEAEKMFEDMLACCNDFGYLSEVVDPKTNEQWGNYPQAYSLMCIIGTARILAFQDMGSIDKDIATEAVCN